MKRIAIFASGNGSNAENIIRYFRDNDAGGDVVLVLSNNPEAAVIRRGENLGVRTAVMSRQEINDPQKILPLLNSMSVDMIVLAGFLLMVPAFIIRAYSGRIINIHPALLPRFGGKGMFGSNVHRAVVEAGETETGITIHHVSEKYDEGRIIFQAKVPLSPTDTPAQVEEKVHILERLHFPRVIAEML